MLHGVGKQNVGWQINRRLAMALILASLLLPRSPGGRAHAEEAAPEPPVQELPDIPDLEDGLPGPETNRERLVGPPAPRPGEQGGASQQAFPGFPGPPNAAAMPPGEFASDGRIPLVPERK